MHAEPISDSVDPKPTPRALVRPLTIFELLTSKKLVGGLGLKFGFYLLVL